MRSRVQRRSLEMTQNFSITDEQDLGATIDQDLKFHMHMLKVVNKASRVLGLVWATFTCINETTFSRQFTNMVRPHLEHLVSTVPLGQIRNGKNLEKSDKVNSKHEKTTT